MEDFWNAGGVRLLFLTLSVTVVVTLAISKLIDQSRIQGP